jgi:hypothetical protein
LLAPPANLGADPAVLVVMRVPLALVAAQPASIGTCANNGCGELGHELRLSGEDPSGRRANVTATQTERGAREELLDVRLGNVRIGARGAALGAVEAGVDAGGQDSDVHLGPAPVGLQHLLGVGHFPSFA